MLVHPVKALTWLRSLPILKPFRLRKLKDRLNAILFGIVFIVCSVSLIALQVSLRIYDNMLYRESAKALNLLSAAIENELKKIEDISFMIIADPNVQKLLSDKKTTTSLYERYRANSKLQDILNAYAYSEEYVASISLIDSKESALSVGWDLKGFGQTRLPAVIAQAKGAGGKIVWLLPAGGDHELISVRAVRRIENLSLDYLGLLVIRLDMPKLILQLGETYPRADTNLQIYTGEGKLVYGSGDDLDWNDVRLRDGDPYAIKTINHKKYLVAMRRSTYTNWAYINILPYETIYQRVFLMRNLLIIVFSLLFTMVFWLSLRFTKSITRPIENLALIIRQVEKGDFSLKIERSLTESSVEEIKNLYHDFEIMIGRINALIQEDYQKQLLLKDTRYRALQAQINPHFLYNTLDSINWMAKANQQTRISTMVEALGDLLRSSIGKQDIITVQEELGIVRNYIAIQKNRYEERLDFEMQVDEGCLDYPVPKLTLQPIVENAVSYGLENMVDACRIRLNACSDGRTVTFTVEDNGPGMDPDVLEKQRRGEFKPRGSGIGLKNIDDRLKMIFGPAYGIRVTSGINQGTQVKVVIPVGTAG